MAWYLLLAVLTGVVLPVQAGVNHQLRLVLGHPALAAGISFLIGTLALGTYIVAARLSIPAGAFGRTQQIVTAGGRVRTVVGRGDPGAAAIARAYGAVSRISFDGMHYRRDIGRKALIS